MKFSVAFIAAAILALSNTAIADVEVESDAGSYKDVEFPFTQAAIIEAVALAEDVVPIVLDDAVYFINTTIANEDMANNMDLSKRAAEAWSWKLYFPGQPLGKRDADADAEPWSWKLYFPGQPLGKREAEAEAEPWSWKLYFPGQPLGKRDADADAEPWSWKLYFPGQPLGKRDADAEAWSWKKYFPGQPLGKRSEGGVYPIPPQKRDANAEPWSWKLYFPGQPLGR